MAVIGTGVQGKIQTEGIQRSAWCDGGGGFGLTGGSMAQYTAQFQGRVGITVCNSIMAALEGADIVVTANPCNPSTYHERVFKPGVHINAMGADTKGKSELDESVLAVAEIFTDDLHQLLTIGELQRNLDRTAIEIGDVLLGNYSGRQREEQITVFDSTGLALQDLTTAELALQIARERGIGTVLHW